MNNNILIFSIILLFVSCTLFNSPDYEYKAELELGEYYIDSFIIDTPGLYQFEFYSEKTLDIVFFENYKYIQLFIDSNYIYSETIFYPLFFTSNDYFLQNVFIYSEKTLYFIIDNSDAIEPASDYTDFTLNIYYKEE